MIESPTLRCLAVRQPFAELIREGSKTIEVRSRRTTHRGPLAIYASSSADAADVEDQGFAKGECPRSSLRAIVHVVDCRPMRLGDITAACSLVEADENDDLNEEIEGSFAWVLDHVRPAEGLDRLSSKVEGGGGRNMLAIFDLSEAERAKVRVQGPVVWTAWGLRDLDPWRAGEAPRLVDPLVARGARFAKRFA